MKAYEKDKHWSENLYISLFLPQLSQFYDLLDGEDCSALWQLEHKGFQPATDMYTNTAALLSLRWLAEQSAWTSREHRICVLECFVHSVESADGEEMDPIKLSWQGYSK